MYPPYCFVQLRGYISIARGYDWVRDWIREFDFFGEIEIFENNGSIIEDRINDRNRGADFRGKSFYQNSFTGISFFVEGRSIMFDDFTDNSFIMD